jgi:hypothetical protein
MAGLTIVCPGCGQQLTVPSLSSLPRSSSYSGLRKRGTQTRTVCQYQLRHLFVLTTVCALASGSVYYLGVDFVISFILFVVFWTMGAPLAFRSARKAIHFFWDSIVRHAPRR